MIAISIVDALGWRALAVRLREHLPNQCAQAVFLPMGGERTFADRLHASTGRFFWLCEAMRGRRIAQRAIEMGCDRLLLATIHNAPLLPTTTRLRYVVYSDSSPEQLAELGYGRLQAHDRLIMRRLPVLPARFAFTSRWAAESMARFRVAASRTTVVPHAVPLDDWSRRERRAPQLRTALFLGGDFLRKGGDLVRQLSIAYPNIRFVFVTKEVFVTRENEALVNGVVPGSKVLIDIVHSADLLVLPTRADCSSIAAIECAAASVPAISTSVGGVPEVVLNGRTGTIVPPDDFKALDEAFRRYTIHPRLLVDHGQAAYENACLNHGIDLQVNRLLELLK